MSIASPTILHRFLSVTDIDPSGIADLLTLARALKAGRMPGPDRSPLAGRAVALIFQKPSLRTRVSFEVGIARLGGTPVVLVGEEVGLGSREVPRDVAHTLERYVDAIVARVFDHSLLEDLAAATRIPVINALSDAEHPCEAIADVMALREHLGDLRGRQLVYVGDGNNVAASLVLAGASVGLHVRVDLPPGLRAGCRCRGSSPVRRAADGRPDRGGQRPGGRDRRSGCGLYRCLGEHGPGGTGRTPAGHLPVVRGHVRAVAGGPGRARDALPAGASGGRDRPPRSWTDRAASCSTRRRIASGRRWHF